MGLDQVKGAVGSRQGCAPFLQRRQLSLGLGAGAGSGDEQVGGAVAVVEHVVQAGDVGIQPAVSENEVPVFHFIASHTLLK